MALPSHIARYTVVQPIAAGGMGEVFLARDEKLDRLVAIKLLREGFDSADLHQRFEEEARNVAKLTHPNIVTIYEFGAHETRPYIAMEYIAGHSLAEIIKRRLPISVARRVRLIEEVCSGLAHAHKAHLVHRDVKPANLMMTTSGLVKVLDFGIAKLRGTDRTQKGMIVGTVNYMSPEQITGQPVDHRSDVFAVGAVLYEILTYEQAFKGDLTTAMFAIVHGHPEPLANRVPGLDPAFQTVIDRCLAKSPDDRYQDLGQLKRDLARLRRPLEEAEDADVSDTVAPLDVEQTIVAKVLKPASSLDGRAIGPDTRRALGSALAAGEAAMTAGQFESAMRFAQQALSLESQNISAKDLMARATSARDREAVAAQLQHARDALAVDRLDEARASLEAAAALAPDSNTVRTVALQVDERAADLERFDRTVLLARERFAAQDFAAARDLTDTIANIRPGNTSLKRLRDEIEQADGRYRAWLKAELTAVDEIVAHQDFDGALERVDAAAARAPQAPELKARASQIRAARDAVARAEDERRREAETRRRAEEDRVQKMAGLLEKARRTTEPLLARRDAAAELVRLDAQHKEGAALLQQLSAAVEEAARQRALDDLLTAGQALLEQGQLDAADAQAAEVQKARPNDARVQALRLAIATRRKALEATRAAIGRAEAAAAAGRFGEAITQLEALDTRDEAVATVLDRVRTAATADARRRQREAQQARLRALATDTRVLGGAGAAAVIGLAAWLWPASPTPTPGPAVTPSPTVVERPVTNGPSTPAPSNVPPPKSGPTAPTTPRVATPTPQDVSTNPPPVKTEPIPEPIEPAPVSTSPRIMYAGADVPVPTRTRYVEPAYPPTAAAARREGVVSAEITVDPEGLVTGTSIRRSVPGLDGAALAAIRQWRFQPTVKDGQRVSVKMTVDVPFKLPPAAESKTADVTPPPGSTGPVRPSVKEDTRAENAERPAIDKPAIEKPVSPPPPPKVDEGAALRQADQTAIRAIVDRFGAAYQSEDVNGLKATWPAMPRDWESGLRRTFQTYRNIGWSSRRVDVDPGATRATAICEAIVTQTDIRSNVTTTGGRTYRFTFERGQSGWALLSVEALGGPR